MVWLLISGFLIGLGISFLQTPHFFKKKFFQILLSTTKEVMFKILTPREYFTFFIYILLFLLFTTYVYLYKIINSPIAWLSYLFFLYPISKKFTHTRRQYGINSAANISSSYALAIAGVSVVSFSILYTSSLLVTIENNENMTAMLLLFFVAILFCLWLVFFVESLRLRGLEGQGKGIDSLEVIVYLTIYFLIVLQIFSANTMSALAHIVCGFVLGTTYFSLLFLAPQPNGNAELAYYEDKISFSFGFLSFLLGVFLMLALSYIFTWVDGLSFSLALLSFYFVTLKNNGFNLMEIHKN
jgi:hypothetical protein